MDISIVIPVYNVDKYLRRCLDSVCAQDECVKEIILINDGSTDDSLKICKEYSERNKRIRIIDQENKGLSATVRIGVEAATSELIGFVDSDDYIEPNMYRSLYDKMTETNADVVFCDYDKVDENGTTVCNINLGIPGNNDVFEKRGGNFECRLLPTVEDSRFISGTRCNKLFKKSDLINNISFIDRNIRIGEDIAITIPVLFKAKRLAYVRKYMYHYVQHNDSMVFTYKTETIKDWESIVDVLSSAAKEYEYDFENFDNNSLALLYAVCISKVHQSDLSRSQKAKQYRIIGDNPAARRLLKTVKVKTTFKHKLVIKLMKRRLYKFLSVIY